MKKLTDIAVKEETAELESLQLGQRVNDVFTVILCPVCEHKTLDNYYICRYCGWEYDGFSDRHYSAANGTTLEEYRENYNQGKRGGNANEF
jgi:hypothetical protein